MSRDAESSAPPESRPSAPMSAPRRGCCAGEATERELLGLLGDRRAELLAFVRRRVRTDADAEDLLQQALVRAAEHLPELRAKDRAVAWLYRVLRNLIADHRAAVATRAARHEELGEELPADPPEEPRTTCGCTLRMLDELRPEYAAVLRRIDLEGASTRDAAAALGLTVGNAKVRVHRARKALRDELASRCGTRSAAACLDCSCDDAGNTCGSAARAQAARGSSTCPR